MFSKTFIRCSSSQRQGRFVRCCFYSLGETKVSYTASGPNTGGGPSETDEDSEIRSSLSLSLLHRPYASAIAMRINISSASAGVHTCIRSERSKRERASERTCVEITLGRVCTRACVGKAACCVHPRGIAKIPTGYIYWGHRELDTRTVPI